MGSLDPIPQQAETTRPLFRSPEVTKFFYQNMVYMEPVRFKRIDRYEAFYKCLAYAHQELDWWGYPADRMETISPEVVVPLGFTQPALGALSVRHKRPTAPFNLAKVIVDRFTSLLLSDQRRPEVIVEGDPQTEDFLQAVTDQMRFWPKWREARTIGGAVGSVCVTAHLQDGKFMMDVHNPKHLTPIWKDRRSFLLEGFIKQYITLREEQATDPKTGAITGAMKLVPYLYRRIITEHEDIIFKPVLYKPGEPMPWEVETFVAHELGFFPGTWVQNLAVPDDVDGDPDCHGAWQNFDTMDRLIAQMNKGTLLNLDPTMVLSMDPKFVDGLVVKPGSDFALNVGPGGAAHYMEITGAGINVAAELLKRLIQNTLEVVSAVLVDPEKISGQAQSAKAIELIYAPMLAKADNLRAQYGDLGIVPFLEIIVKMAQHFTNQSAVDIKTGQPIRYTFKLPKRIVETPPPQGALPNTPPTIAKLERVIGPGGNIVLKWGPYFQPTDTDKQMAINNILAAKQGGLMDEETAIKQFAPLYNIKNPKAMLEKIRDEQSKQSMMGMPMGMEGAVPPGAPELGQPAQGQPLPEGQPGPAGGLQGAGG